MKLHNGVEYTELLLHTSTDHIPPHKGQLADHLVAQCCAAMSGADGVILEADDMGLIAADGDNACLPQPTHCHLKQNRGMGGTNGER